MNWFIDDVLVIGKFRIIESFGVKLTSWKRHGGIWDGSTQFEAKTVS